MAATARRLVTFSILYLNRMKRVQFQVTLPIAPHGRTTLLIVVIFPFRSVPGGGMEESWGKEWKKALRLSCFSRLGDGSGPCSDKFHKWHNGGGNLHEWASIDSSVVVEIGAVVHSEAVVGSNVHIGSGTIVGPSVIIGHSTKIGTIDEYPSCCFARVEALARAYSCNVRYELYPFYDEVSPSLPSHRPPPEPEFTPNGKEL
ncbi:hypothetical protein K1719_005416 [Acacia pycnantha]|nr:hypothetical protein K1719_005416 [Acacia pycnantha]